MSRKRKQNGGLLRGPSHERGGMPAIIGGQEPVELEGGEYIIRKSSVNKYGAETMARINQGLVDPNKLRSLQNGGYATPRGGGGNNPIVETNLRARQGQFIYQHNNQLYTGLYHTSCSSCRTSHISISIISCYSHIISPGSRC